MLQRSPARANEDSRGKRWAWAWKVLRSPAGAGLRPLASLVVIPQSPSGRKQAIASSPLPPPSTATSSKRLATAGGVASKEGRKREAPVGVLPLLPPLATVADDRWCYRLSSSWPAIASPDRVSPLPARSDPQTHLDFPFRAGEIPLPPLFYYILRYPNPIPMS